MTADDDVGASKVAMDGITTAAAAAAKCGGGGSSSSSSSSSSGGGGGTSQSYSIEKMNNCIIKHYRSEFGPHARVLVTSH
jgi:hypothetical protein